MSIPENKVKHVQELAQKVTKDILEFCDTQVPEASITDIELILVGITNSIREQISRKEGYNPGELD